MFSMGSPLTYSHSANTGDATATTTITDATALLATDFAVQLGPDGYQVTRLDNGKTVPATFDAATNTLSFAGVEVSFAGAQ